MFVLVSSMHHREQDEYSLFWSFGSVSLFFFLFLLRSSPVIFPPFPSQIRSKLFQWKEVQDKDDEGRAVGPVRLQFVEAGIGEAHINTFRVAGASKSTIKGRVVCQLREKRTENLKWRKEKSKGERRNLEAEPGIGEAHIKHFVDLLEHRNQQEQGNEWFAQVEREATGNFKSTNGNQEKKKC